MYQLCEKLVSLTPYDPPRGDFIVRADANESFLTPPPALLDAICAAIRVFPFNRYPDPMASALCAAYAGYVGASPDQVAAGNGADELIGLIIGAFLQKGEPVLVIAPDFSMYDFYAHLYENPVFTLQKGPGLRIDTDAVLEAARELKPRLILFSNPCNPTGLGLPREEVLRLCRGTGALTIVDEAYMDFWDQSIVPEIGGLDNVIVLRTCSKLIGLAGLRMGFAVANKPLIRAMKAGKSPYNVNSLTQKIGEIILSDRAYVEESRQAILRAREELGDGLRRLATQKSQIKAVYPSCTNFFYMELENADEAAEALLRRGVAVRHLGEALRMSACATKENALLLKALDEILK